jgi:uncharacterized membrane protein YgdD (TMEM256/DUF423 family)
MARTDSPARVALLAAGIVGCTGVALGALGSHALKVALLERGMVQVWGTAAEYHLLHAAALLAWAALGRDPSVGGTRTYPWITWLWISGVVLFSGSLYCIAIGGPRWLGPVTPIGGVALIAGWALAAAHALRRDGKG